MLSFEYDPTTRLWVLEPGGGAQPIRVERLALDVKLSGDRGRFKIEEPCGIVHRSEASSFVHLKRAKPLPGWENAKCHNEWLVALTGNTPAWYVHRQDMQGVVVTTDRLELNCHGITSEGRIHCNAEMILEGRTNRTEKLTGASRVLLRTLTVYDQVVHVPAPIALVPSARRP